jgi:predicted Zn-dependent protease
MGSLVVLLQQFPIAHIGLGDQIAAVSAQIARDPANPVLFQKRGELFREAREYQQALADLDRAASLDPAMATVDLVRARLFLDAGKPQAAVDAASRFLARQPGHVAALITRGRARAKLGRAGAAALDFTHALDAQPLPDLYIERARVILASGNRALDEALRSLDEGIGRLGPIVTLELEAIDLELRMTRYDAALARLDRVSIQAARKESWLARRGEILASAGRVDEARSAYRAALASALSLPPWIQHTQASLALIDRLHAGLARLGAAPASLARGHSKGLP